MSGPAERALRATRLRLYAVTLGLIAPLVIGIGGATALVGLNALDADVDRALTATVDEAVASLHGELPSAGEDRSSEREAPAAADTFLLLLDPTGRLIANTSGVALAGLPQTDAVTAASEHRSDLRTVTAGGLNVRLLTVAVDGEDGASGFVQGGFVLTLHDRQSQSLVLTILSVGAAGLAGAALVTLLVTGRALGPIRRTLEAQRRFVADASHELRTPAALIRANAEVLQRERLVADEGRPMLDDVIAEADRLAGLVGDLLQLAAWDETRVALAVTPLDMAAVARDTVRGAAALAAERGVVLAVDAPGSAVALADRDRAVQLLLILLDNAIDHSPPGASVTVRARTEDGGVVVEVEDEGPGIPVAERERVFAPFTRLTGTTRHGSGGTGLGLAIARRIVDAHRGTIRVDSPGIVGARFTVTLPAAASAARPAPVGATGPSS